MYINFAQDLFLEVIELNKFKQSLDDNGFRFALLQEAVNFGLIKTISNTDNGRVRRDLDIDGQKSIQIAPLVAINNQGQFIRNAQTNNILVPTDNNWYWVKISQAYSNLEKGKVGIDSSGNVTGVNTEFTKVLRGGSDFPSVVKFTNSTGNTLEYEVLEVVDDTHMIVSHPAITAGGAASFILESNLSYAIVGTFTDGVTVNIANKYPFNYDSCNVTLVVETTANVRPTYVVGQEFYLARVKSISGLVVVQDKRTDYFETKGAQKVISIDRGVNALVGVEAVKWENQFTASDQNIVEIGFGMRSTNWSVDPSTNTITFAGSSLGGSFKSGADFTTGNFDGWRLYFANGKHSRVLSSVKQGSAINLVLDYLDVDNISSDGGTTFNADQLLVVPDADEIEFKFSADPSDVTPNVSRVLKFAINTPIAKCLVVAYKDPTSMYNVQYRYKSFKENTVWRPINNGVYYTEASYDSLGTILAPGSQVTRTYTADPSAGFIALNLSPKAYHNFAATVYKGDVIGVNTITSLTAGAVVPLRVGVDKRYQHITGTYTLTTDIYFDLQNNATVVAGNEFRLHFDCILNTNGYNIYIVDNYAGGGAGTPLKTISLGDAYQMLNQKGGIVIDCVYDELGKWTFSQNYTLGQPGEIKQIDGTVTALFDTTTGLGKVRGLFGYVLCDGVHTTVNGFSVPNLSERFLLGQDGSNGLYVAGATGGEATHTLIPAEMPIHKHTNLNKPTGKAQRGAADVQFEALSPDGGTYTSFPDSDTAGGDQPHNNMPPFYAIIYCKKVF
jgi:hypothetical protein